MSKGFGNFMSKKGFHPGSFANRKRVQEAEEKAEIKRKQEEERMIEYRKQQEMIDQMSLVSGVSKERLSLDFMYGIKPGEKKSGDQKDKVEWTGSNPSKAINSYIPSTSKNQADSRHRIKLEWQREKPLRIPPKNMISACYNEPTSSTSRVKTEIKLESQVRRVKSLTKDSKVKEEQESDDLRAERGNRDYLEDDYRLQHEPKRIKKEL